MSQEDYPIDIVIIWVDGDDPVWVKDFNKHVIENPEGDYRRNRYRDWEFLRYWFRSIEKNANWFNKIFFVTCGHIPSWLNRNNNRLVIINHKDYIPEDALPTFNANPIEINLHRIHGLSEHFIFFNDDMFIVQKTKRTDFFHKERPVDTAILNAYAGGELTHILMNDLEVINKHFSKRDVLRHNIGNWFNVKYGLYLLRTLCLLPWPRFTGFINHHQPQPFLKKTFLKLWDKEQALLESVTLNKFRSSKDVNQYLFRYWQFCEGAFHPSKARGYLYEIKGLDITILRKILVDKSIITICLNDDINDIHFDETRKQISDVLNSIFPHISTFEL